MSNQRINSGSYIYRLYNLMSRGNRGFLLNDRVTSALSIGQTKTFGSGQFVVAIYTAVKLGPRYKDWF